MKSILVVDDSEIVLEALCETLAWGGWTVRTCQNPMQVPALVSQERPDVLLIDLEMPALKGPDIVRALRRSDLLQRTRAVLYSGTADDAAVKTTAIECGASGAISKDLTGSMLLDQIELFAWPARLADTPQALVIAGSGAVEHVLVTTLESLTLQVSVRGAIGLDRALRSSSAALVVISLDAIEGDLTPVLNRLGVRGLLTDRNVLVVDPRSGSVRLYGPKTQLSTRARDELQDRFRSTRKPLKRPFDA